MLALSFALGGCVLFLLALALHQNALNCRQADEIEKLEKELDDSLVSISQIYAIRLELTEKLFGEASGVTIGLVGELIEITLKKHLDGHLSYNDLNEEPPIK